MNTVHPSPFNAAGSRFGPCHLLPGSTLLYNFFSTSLLPCHTETKEEGWVVKWGEEGRPRGGEGVEATGFIVQGGVNRHIPKRFSAISARWQTRRREDDSTASTADQATMIEVSLSTALAPSSAEITRSESGDFGAVVASSSSTSQEPASASSFPKGLNLFESPAVDSGSLSTTEAPFSTTLWMSTSEISTSLWGSEFLITSSIRSPTSISASASEDVSSLSFSHSTSFFPPVTPTIIEACSHSIGTSSSSLLTSRSNLVTRSGTDSSDPSVSSSSSTESSTAPTTPEPSTTPTPPSSPTSSSISTSSPDASRSSTSATTPTSAFSSSIMSDTRISVTSPPSTTSETTSTIYSFSSSYYASPRPPPSTSSYSSFWSPRWTPHSIPPTSAPTSKTWSKTWSDATPTPPPTSQTWSDILPGGSASTTATTTVETGVLNTDIPREAGFSRNIGAIVGISLSATFVLILIAFLTFFACKRYRARRITTDSMDNILAVTQSPFWRPPLGGDDDSSYLETSYSRAQSPHHRSMSGSQGHGSGGGSVGDHLSGEGGFGSAESANTVMVPAMTTMFGGQTYMPGVNTELPRPPDPAAYPQLLPEQTTQQVWWGSNEPQTFYPTSRTPTINRHVSIGGSRSATSLTLVACGSSSGGHSSSGDGLRRGNTNRSSGSGPGAMPDLEGRRRRSMPPSAFLDTRDTHADLERQRQQQADQSDKMSVKSVFSRLRGGRKTSMQSIATVKAGPRQQRSEEPMTAMTMATNVYSPSLLNPPIPLPTTTTAMHSILSFPRDVTGNSPPGLGAAYSPPLDTVLWPPLTLPPAPSPVPTDDSSMIEGLLHPRLSMRLNLTQQPSLTSLRDHEDYSRPISGLVNNHITSTSTFDSQDTREL